MVAGGEDGISEREEKRWFLPGVVGGEGGRRGECGGRARIAVVRGVVEGRW